MKYLKYLKEYFNYNINVDDFATLIVTHECNKNCKFCIDKYRGNDEYISIENVIKSMKYAKKNNIKEILIVGGEPTLHPKIIEISKIIKKFGFKTILTTNYSKPDIIKQLDGIIDNFNISFYNQNILPKQKDFKSDITLNVLLHKKQLNTKDELDNFIDKYKEYGQLKFSTLSICNDWTEKNQKLDYLDQLKGKNIILFGEIEGIIYRDCIIKRFDKIVNTNSKQSIKFHVDGEISRSWNRQVLDEVI